MFASLDKPLWPIFVCPGSTPDINLLGERYPVILLTASRCVANGHERVGGFVYVQGAADDEESWSHGLNSTQFWQNHSKLLACTQEDEIVEVVTEVIRNYTPAMTKGTWSQIGSTNVYLGIGRGMSETPTILCDHGEGEALDGSKVLKLSIPSKSKPLTIITQKLFPAAVSFALTHGILSNTPIAVVATDSSRQLQDLSTAVTLVLLCLFFDDQGTSPPTSMLKQAPQPMDVRVK